MAETSFEADKFRMVLCSHGRKSETSITMLSADIIFMILILLPAEVLYNVVRYVCREWYGLVQDPRFVSKHNLSSTSTLLMHTTGFDLDVYQLLDVGDRDVRLTDFKFELPVRVHVRSTCNGLLLMEDIVQKIFYVGNPITRRILALPILSSFMSPISVCCSLAFEPSCRVYKVVMVFEDLRLDSETLQSPCFECAVLTVGVDKGWRVLNLTDLKKKNVNMGFLLKKQIPFTGIIYWYSPYDRYTFALDIKSEIMILVSVPGDYHKIGHFLPKGNSISFMTSHKCLSMEVWVLEGHKSEDGMELSYVPGKLIRNEWENFLSHNNLRTRVAPKRLVTPESWLGNGEKILFSMAKCVPLDSSTNSSDNCYSYGHFVVYDRNTHTCFAVDTKHAEDRDIVPFVSSSAWI